jgi:hypothetical protein
MPACARAVSTVAVTCRDDAACLGPDALHQSWERVRP